SLRASLNVLVAFKIIHPDSGLRRGAGSTSGTVIALVTPCIVRFPSISQSFPLGRRRVLWNITVGYFSTSKKSLVFKCWSRFPHPVSRLFAGAMIVTDEFSGLAGS